MERDKALKIVAEQLTEHRYVHTLGVMETAISLAELYGEMSRRQKQQLFFTIMLSSDQKEMKKLLKNKICPKNC